MPNDPKKAAELITKGKKIRMDLGYAKTSKESGCFSMMLDVGTFAQVIKDTTSEFKKNGKDLHIRFGCLNFFSDIGFNSG